VTCTVIWLSGNTVVETSFHDEFLTAVRHAKEQFPIKMSRLGVTAAEVRDENDKCLLRHAMPAEPDGPEPPKRRRLSLRR